MPHLLMAGIPSVRRACAAGHPTFLDLAHRLVVQLLGHGWVRRPSCPRALHERFPQFFRLAQPTFLGVPLHGVVGSSGLEQDDACYVEAHRSLIYYLDVLAGNGLEHVPEENEPLSLKDVLSMGEHSLVEGVSAPCSSAAVCLHFCTCAASLLSTTAGPSTALRNAASITA